MDTTKLSIFAIIDSDQQYISSKLKELLSYLLCTKYKIGYHNNILSILESKDLIANNKQIQQIQSLITGLDKLAYKLLFKDNHVLNIKLYRLKVVDHAFKALFNQTII